MHIHKHTHVCVYMCLYISLTDFDMEKTGAIDQV